MSFQCYLVVNCKHPKRKFMQTFTDDSRDNKVVFYWLTQSTCRCQQSLRCKLYSLLHEDVDLWASLYNLSWSKLLQLSFEDYWTKVLKLQCCQNQKSVILIILCMCSLQQINRIYYFNILTASKHNYAQVYCLDVSS